MLARLLATRDICNQSLLTSCCPHEEDYGAPQILVFLLEHHPCHRLLPPALPGHQGYQEVVLYHIRNEQ